MRTIFLRTTTRLHAPRKARAGAGTRRRDRQRRQQRRLYQAAYRRDRPSGSSAAFDGSGGAPELLQPGEVLERTAATFRPALERRGIRLTAATGLLPD